MDKIWLSSYPEGVPAEINPEQYSSLTQLLEESFKSNAANPFAVCMEQWMTYKEVDVLSAAMGAWLQSQGLEPGARVAIMLPNLPQFSVTMAGILRASYTCVNVNPLYTPRELEHQLRDSGATTIVILENFATTLIKIIDNTPIKRVVITSVGDLLGAAYGKWITFAVRHLKKAVPEYSFSLANGLQVTPFAQAIATGKRIKLRPSTATLDSTAFLQYTGGTTGLSKGAVLTHRNVVAAVLQAEAWFKPAVSRIGDLSKVNAIAALPLYHIFALTLSLLSVRWGAFITMVPNPRDFDGFVKTLKKRPFHVLPAVNTLFNALLQNPEFKSVDFSSLCLSQAGGMAASEGTAKSWQEATGSTMIEGWGMSETVAIGTNNPVTNKQFTGSIGLPLPSISIAIKNESEENVPTGESGEICIKGPNVMVGYYNQSEENKNAFTKDGYFKTGDVGIMDEQGYIKIIDRLKDMIIVSGFNVYPNEIENAVSLCPGVLECAVIGVPDDKTGEAIKLFVVKKDTTLSEEVVKAYCRENFTGYKMPKHIVFRTDLPKTNVGKILRRELRSEN